MSLTQLEREVRFLKGYAVFSTTAVIFAFLTAFGAAQGQRQRFTEIDVERVNIVEPDGRVALAIANTQRMPGPMIEGKELPRELSEGRIGSAGMIFFDSQQNEIGGLVYRLDRNADGTYSAARSLTFDQHNQDQVVGLQYSDNGKTRGSGLNVWDRPTRISMKDIISTVQGTPDRPALEKRFAELAKQRGETSLGARRVFLGSQDQAAALRLMDTEGRERVRITVDAANTPRMEFLDPDGNIVYSLPR
jgi:hypothetical protein